MSQAASQAWAFYKDVAKTHRVWTIRDSGGYPAPLTKEGKRAMPFWSSLSRVEIIIKNVPAYAGFEPVELSWEDLCKKWLPGLKKDGLLAELNWSGPRAVGYDLDPDLLQKYVEQVVADFKAGLAKS